MPIDIDDALELLSPAFKNHNVRSFSVNQLRRAGDDVIIIILKLGSKFIPFTTSSSIKI